MNCGFYDEIFNPHDQIDYRKFSGILVYCNSLYTIWYFKGLGVWSQFWSIFSDLNVYNALERHV